ncbi:MAG: histidinol phosphate phosphatase domain-containing protein [bacterium]|nr:histidinol phosphate phosphatase domain-containing protein [bacterium]
MIDLHTHTFLSDGILVPSELVYSEKIIGYKAIAITDHVDYSNYKQVIEAVNAIKGSLIKEYDIKVMSGVEISYVPPNLIKDITDKCRRYGADIIVVHGETISEHVPPGTNHAAIEAHVDILAHPGFITNEDVILATENDVCLEITTRLSHSQTNKHVASIAKKYKARLVLNNDVHAPKDIADKTRLLEVCEAAGLTENDYQEMLQNSSAIVSKQS